MAARLNEKLIAEAVANFPSGNGWTLLSCKDCGIEGKKRTDWKSISHLKMVGGLYAFLLPARFFESPRTILLHAPRNKPRISFEFSVKPVFDGLGVLYVGRTTKLKQRFCAHFRIGKRIASSQVKYGLMDCKCVAHRNQKKCQLSAIDFMRTHGRIAYFALTGPEQTANREIIELSLCAQYHPPFNIKSER